MWPCACKPCCLLQALLPAASPATLFHACAAAELTPLYLPGRLMELLPASLKEYVSNIKAH